MLIKTRVPFCNMSSDPRSPALYDIQKGWSHGSGEQHPGETGCAFPHQFKDDLHSLSGTPILSDAASKHAIQAFFDCLRAEVQEYGISISTVSHTFIKATTSPHPTPKTNSIWS
ncbi:hypothetical protein P4O66_007297, partial [Electrophorus voltai]